MKLYLAGPDVFRPDAAEWAATARETCRRAGHEALVPLEDVARGATDIYRDNLALITAADAVIANLNPFRGAEPDSGTCVEVGYALALSKPVVGYAADLRCLRERLDARRDGARWVDAQGHAVEDFGLPLNLMLAVPLRLAEGDLAAALGLLAT